MVVQPGLYRTWSETPKTDCQALLLTVWPPYLRFGSFCNPFWLLKIQIEVQFTLMPYQVKKGGSSPTLVKPCCVLEQGTFTPPKVLVIPRKRWLRPNMTEKLFTGTLRINQPTKQVKKDVLILLADLTFTKKSKKVWKYQELKQSEPKSSPQNQNGK